MGRKKSKLRVVKGGKNGRRKKTVSKKGFDEATFYKKYKHVVPNSVKEAKVGSVVDGCKVAHGRVCKIKCKETGKLRTINVQDAFQTFFTAEVQKRKQLERAAERRKKKNGKKRKTKAS